MDPNLLVLLVLIVPTVIVGGVVAILLSERVRELGMARALRRLVGGGDRRDIYGRLIR